MAIGDRLIFEAQCVATSKFIYTADGNRLLIQAHGHVAGDITLPHMIPTLSSCKETSIIFLVGTSRRRLCFCYLTAYRPASLLGAQDKRKYNALRHFPKIAIAIPILAGEGMFLRWFVGLWASDPNFWAVFWTMLIVVWSFIATFLALYFLGKGILLVSGIGGIAHVVWVEDVGDGVYERKGAGEMSLGVFNNANPEKKMLKLR